MTRMTRMTWLVGVLVGVEIPMSLGALITMKRFLNSLFFPSIGCERIVPNRQTPFGNTKNDCMHTASSVVSSLATKFPQSLFGVFLRQFVQTIINSVDRFWNDG